MSDTLLTTQQAAAYLAISAKTLERFRCEGSGPVYVKAGPGKRARVRYKKSDLDAYIARQRRTSTSAAAVEVA